LAVGESAASSGTSAFPERRKAGIIWFRSTPIYKFARDGSALIVCSPSCGTKLLTEQPKWPGNGAGFYGKPYQPGAIIKNDIEYILFLRKGGEYRSVPSITKALSMLTREEMKDWQRSIWTDLRGASTREGHPAPFPVNLATRLIRLFSFAGDTVLDPFAGTGSTSQAAIMTGRNSIANEIEPAYVRIARQRIAKAAREPRVAGSTEAQVILDGDALTTRVPATHRVPAAV
jgi:DNA modification methylase